MASTQLPAEKWADFHRLVFELDRQYQQKYRKPPSPRVVNQHLALAAKRSGIRPPALGGTVTFAKADWFRIPEDWSIPELLKTVRTLDRVAGRRRDARPMVQGATKQIGRPRGWPSMQDVGRVLKQHPEWGAPMIAKVLAAECPGSSPPVSAVSRRLADIRRGSPFSESPR